jgi:uncharacterized protein (DUF427 family)
MPHPPFPPGATLHIEDSPRRVRAVFGGETIADSRRAKLMLERGHRPVYYFPRPDVRLERLTRTAHSTH